MQKPSGCDGCKLVNIGGGFSLPEGNASNGVAIIGEALGHNEERDEKPFRPYAASGSLLERAFRIIRGARSQFILDNIVKCHPPKDELVGKSYEHDAIRHCMNAHWSRVFERGDIRCIVAVGGTATRVLTGLSGDLLGVSDLRGYILDGAGYAQGIPVIPTYHPSYIRQSGKLAYLDYLIHDIKKAISVSEGFRPNGKTDYLTHPSLEDVIQFGIKCRDNPNLLLSYDIETDESGKVEEHERDSLAAMRITSIQFSVAETTGLCLSLDSHFKYAISLVVIL